MRRLPAAEKLRIEELLDSFDPAQGTDHCFAVTFAIVNVNVSSAIMLEDVASIIVGYVVEQLRTKQKERAESLQEIIAKLQYHMPTFVNMGSKGEEPCTTIVRCTTGCAV